MRRILRSDFDCHVNGTYAGVSPANLHEFPVPESSICSSHEHRLCILRPEALRPRGPTESAAYCQGSCGAQCDAQVSTDAGPLIWSTYANRASRGKHSVQGCLSRTHSPVHAASMLRVNSSLLVFHRDASGIAGFTAQFLVTSALQGETRQ